LDCEADQLDKMPIMIGQTHFLPVLIRKFLHPPGIEPWFIVHIASGVVVVSPLLSYSLSSQSLGFCWDYCFLRFRQYEKQHDEVHVKISFDKLAWHY
jgi:hypothetical protein